MEMRKIGINFNNNYVLSNSTGTIEQSHINIYWNEEYGIGINPESDIVKALKSLDMRIPINIVTGNEYIKTSGPKIEIVLGNDYKNYFSSVSYTHLDVYKRQHQSHGCDRGGWRQNGQGSNG